MYLILAVLMVVVLIAAYRLLKLGHERMLLKGVAGLAVLALIVAGVLYYGKVRSAKLAKERLGTISIAYMPDSATIAKESPELTDDTLTWMTFHLCNNGADTVTSLSFYPKTLRRGTPERYGAVMHPPSDPNAKDEMTLTYEIAPAACTTMSWMGSTYLVMDTVIAEVSAVNVKD